jgi:hypothetical protein
MHTTTANTGSVGWYTGVVRDLKLKGLGMALNVTQHLAGGSFKWRETRAHRYRFHRHFSRTMFFVRRGRHAPIRHFNCDSRIMRIVSADFVQGLAIGFDPRVHADQRPTGCLDGV